MYYAESGDEEHIYPQITQINTDGKKRTIAYSFVSSALICARLCNLWILSG